jgi:sugar-specific transcriptional regulator TrmB
MIKLLQALGLTPYESKTYLALVKLGTSKTGAILKASGINTGKIYEILESLKRKGLVAESEINGVKHFTAGPSTNLQTYLAKKKRILAIQETQALELIPKLDALAHSTKPTIRTVVYTGFRGFVNAATEATTYLEKNDELRGMGLRTAKPDKFSRFWQAWTKANKNKQRVLFSEKGDHYEKTVMAPTAQARVLTSITPSTVVMFGTKVSLIIQYDEPVSVIAIYDERTTKSFISFFEQLWEKAQKNKS